MAAWVVRAWAAKACGWRGKVGMTAVAAGPLVPCAPGELTPTKSPAVKPGFRFGWLLVLALDAKRAGPVGR